MKIVILTFALLFAGCKESSGVVTPPENHDLPGVTVYSVASHVPNLDMSTATFRVSFLKKSDLPSSVYAYANDYSRHIYTPNISFQESDSSYLYVMSVDTPITIREEIKKITMICKFGWTTDSTTTVAIFP